MKLPIITKNTRRPLSDEVLKDLEIVWDKFTVERGYGYFEFDLFDQPGKPSYAKHIERLDDMDVFDSDIEAAFYGEKFFGEKLFHYDLGPDEELSNYWFVDEPETRRDVEDYLTRRFGQNHGIKPDYETIRRDEIIFEQLVQELKTAKCIEYKGILFDDWTVDEEHCEIWGEMCQCCAEKYKDLISEELDDAGAVGACSVKGCAVVGAETEMEHHYYIDFIPDLIRPLSKEQVKAFECVPLNDKISEAHHKVVEGTAYSREPQHEKER